MVIRPMHDVSDVPFANVVSDVLSCPVYNVCSYAVIVYRQHFLPVIGCEPDDAEPLESTRKCDLSCVSLLILCPCGRSFLK